MSGASPGEDDTDEAAVIDTIRCGDRGVRRRADRPTPMVTAG